MCCSQYVRDTLVKAGKLPPNAGVLFGGTDPEPFLSYSRLGESRPVSLDGLLRFLYFGRLIHDKGVNTALDAIGFLKQRGLADGVDLTVLGSGHPEYEARLRQMVVQLDIGDHVRFSEHVPRKAVPEWLACFDIFLFTSTWPEPMARSVMEAMASGCFCLVHCWNGAEELLPEENLFRTGSELQEKILGYCDVSESERQVQRDHMRAIACDRFDINRTKAEICRVIEEVGARPISSNKKWLRKSVT